MLTKNLKSVYKKRAQTGYVTKGGSSSWSRKASNKETAKYKALKNVNSLLYWI